MNALLLLVPLLLVCQCFGARNCIVNPRLVSEISDTTGPKVVNDVLHKVECSGVFEDDNNFMRRLAYVETADGVDETYIGIWGNTSCKMVHELNSTILSFNYSTLINQIRDDLRIDVLFEKRDCKKKVKTPLVSYVLARFYLHVITVTNKTQIPQSDDIFGQAEFWELYFKREDLSAMDFIVKVNELKGLCQCSNRQETFPMLPEKWMNHDAAFGSCVVEAVLQQLDDSHIFPPDHGFMRRIAYVETRDGTEPTHAYVTETGCYKRVGIWGLTSSKLENMKNKIRDDFPELENVSSHICRVFGVNMTGHEKLNLRNPLVSGIAARFYLLYLTVLQNISDLPETVAGQAHFWQLYYTMNDSFTEHVRFVKRVMELEGCRVNADIVFVLDISNSINSSNLRVELDFEAKFVHNLTIGPDDDRVATVLFGSRAHERFTFSNYPFHDTLLYAVKDLKKYSLYVRQRYGLQTTNTAEGLKYARTLFESDKRPSSTLLRIAIVLSDGVSNNSTHTIEEARKLHNLEPPVLVYGIGVGDKVNEAEMTEIAGNPNHYTHLYDFQPSKFDKVRDQFLTDICCNATIKISVGEMNGILNEHEIARLVINVPDNGLTIRVCSSEGRVSISVFCPVPEDSDVSIPPTAVLQNTTYNYTSKCSEVYVSGPTTYEHSRRRARRETVTTEVHITVEGMETENVFVMDTTDGDDPNDCVGMKVADDCIDPEPPSSEKGSPGDSKGPSKNTVVIPATVSSTGFILICCIVMVSSVGGWVLYRRRKQQQQQQKEKEEEEYKLLDNEYAEM